MANEDRWRSQQYRSSRWDDDRDRGRDRDERRGRRAGEWSRSGSYGRTESDEGYIARRGFGNESAGYDRGGAERRFAEERGYGAQDMRGRERDFGDSAGYGSGGSVRDRREVIGDRDYRPSDVFRDTERRRDQGSWRGPESGRGYGSGDYYRGFYGADQGYSGADREPGAWRDERERGYGAESGRSREERGFFERAGDEVRSWFGDEEAERRRQRDEREGESGWGHRGRGPRNYQRSDERIREDVSDRLTDDPTVDASEIEVSVQNREVTLSGTVQTRFEKRRAEDIAESISGVTHVQNNLRVQNQGGVRVSGSSTSATPTGTTTAAPTTSTTTVESGGATGAGTAVEAGRRRRSAGSSGT